MIHYALRCGAGHEFDGWFNSSASFDTQAAGGLLDCPFCADTAVQRAIMSPRLNKGAAAPTVGDTKVAATPEAKPQVSLQADGAPAISPGPAPEAVASPEKSPAADAARTTTMPMPDRVRAILQRIRIEVEKSCDYVGPKFAETARSIHAGEAPHRPIYGEATQEEATALADEGINVSSIPWVPRADS